MLLPQSRIKVNAVHAGLSATGALEGLSKLGFGALESFSEQQLVDCSGTYGNQACNGGLMDNAFKFVKDHGIVHEDEYPYKAVKQACAKTTGPFKISGFTDIKNCNDLATGLAGRPISVAVDATNWSGYKSGVFNNCATKLNHGVLLVGVTDQYWRIKNSWATSWENKVSSDSPEETLAVFATLLHIPTNDLKSLKIIFINFFPLK